MIHSIENFKFSRKIFRGKKLVHMVGGQNLRPCVRLTALAISLTGIGKFFENFSTKNRPNFRPYVLVLQYVLLFKKVHMIGRGENWPKF